MGKSRREAANRSWSRQEGRCFYCRQPIARADWTRDHVFPLFQWRKLVALPGLEALDTVIWFRTVGACLPCNANKRSRIPPVLVFRRFMLLHTTDPTLKDQDLCPASRAIAVHWTGSNETDWIGGDAVVPWLHRFMTTDPTFRVFHSSSRLPLVDEPTRRSA